MHRFAYKKNRFYCEDVAIEDIVTKVGTPCYVYSIGTFLDHFLKLKKAFKSLNPLICFSVKANSNLTVLSALVRRGSGLDIVSRGELYRAQKVGVDPKKIVFASVGKTEKEIEEAVRFGILMFNVETVQELAVINKVATKLKKIQKVAIRLNPDVQADTHHYITTGTKQNKFGLDSQTAYKLFAEAYRYPHLKFAGIHMHIGSQITQSQPFVQAIEKGFKFIDSVRMIGAQVEFLNIGGGLGIVYSKEKPQTAEAFAKAVLPVFKKFDPGRNIRLILEPGRFVAGNSGVLVAKVIYQKDTHAKSFLIVDAGMNDLIRPSLYGAHHDIVPSVRKQPAKLSQSVDIVGPVCESGDFLAKGRPMPKISLGDNLVVMSCGAYGSVMASNYNSRPKAPEVVVKDNKVYVARKRESLEDLVRLEKIVKEVI